MYDVVINKKLRFPQSLNTSRERSFLICKTCFWCASLLNTHRSVEVCPSCMESELDLMPLAFCETYKFNYDRIRGITLEFGRIK